MFKIRQKIKFDPGENRMKSIANTKIAREKYYSTASMNLKFLLEKRFDWMNEFIGENVGDEGINIEDTHQLLDDYIDGVDTDLNKDRIKMNMRELMTEAQALEIA